MLLNGTGLQITDHDLTALFQLHPIAGEWMRNILLQRRVRELEAQIAEAAEQKASAQVGEA